eukprot:g22398.t1
MFHSMNQSRHDLKARLDFAQQSFDHRLSQLESAQELQRHQLHARATRALEEAEERYQAHVKQLQKQLEMERSSSSAAHYHIEKLRKTLKELREELTLGLRWFWPRRALRFQEKSQEASEVAVLRETCRHLRDSLRDEQRTSQRVPELQRQLEEAQAAQKKLQEKLRKAERAERPGYIAPEPRPKRLGFSAMPCSHASDESDSARRERHPARLEAFLRAVEQNPKILEEVIQKLRSDDFVTDDNLGVDEVDAPREALPAAAACQFLERVACHGERICL